GARQLPAPEGSSRRPPRRHLCRRGRVDRLAADLPGPAAPHQPALPTEIREGRVTAERTPPIEIPASIRHRRSAQHTLRIVCPNGHLGFAPIKTGSFRVGCESEPDLICADSGSCDVGPVPLGADISSSPRQWQMDDLETMLLASRRLGVPMIVGSAGDTGSNSRVDLFVDIIRELAKKHGLSRFRVGYFYSEVGKNALRRRIVADDEIL